MWKLWFGRVPFPYVYSRARKADLHASVNVPCTYRSRAVRSHVGSGLLQFVKEPERLALRQHLLLYTFSKPLQVCFEVSTQSAGERRRGGGGLWTARHGRHPPSPRSIALKFSRKSSPICPNTPSCQPPPKKYLNRGLTYPTRFVYTEPVNKSSVALTASFTGTAECTANAPHLVRHAEWPLPDTASGLFDSVI